MKKAYITIIVILMIGLAACSSEEIPITTTETVVVIETTEVTESTTVPTEMETIEPTTTQSIAAPTEQTDPPSEPTQAPQKPPKETGQTTPPEQTDPPATTVLSVQTEPPAEKNPPEIIDLQALIDYGREYAATTYGYEVCIGLRDGYYPADDHLIYTMKDG